ncbi:DUF3265 domain-containing protein [Vibrio navarrensis]|nr:DUF3265 domain-containing protein [Vibrio navarrensis]EKA5634524.1 DUF3265 domain-containing protein [Vibrio navarrensis]
MTKHLRVIRNTWQFCYTLCFVFKVVCGSISIALLTLTGRYANRHLGQVRKHSSQIAKVNLQYLLFAIFSFC